MESTLHYAIAALALSVVINLVLRKLGISQIIGYIFTGTAITYAFDLHRAADSHLLETAAEFGIVFLMFTIGLEISLEKMRSMKIEVFANGVAQVLLSSGLFFAVAHYGFGVAMAASIIIALALSLSSTAVVLSYLKHSKQIHQPYGQRATGILIFQDLAVIPILLLIGFLSAGEIDFAGVLFDTFWSAILLLVLLFMVGKPVMTYLLHFSAESNIEELFIASVLVILMASSLFAHEMGFTYSLGAFVAGMIIAETKYHHKVEADIAPFKDLLLGLFFVTVGMKINLEFFATHIHQIVLLIAVVFALKSLIIFAIVALTSKRDTALKTALALSQIGEFSFAIFALAGHAALIEPELIELLVLSTVVSLMLTPFMIARTDALVVKWLGEQTFDNRFEHLAQRRNHIVVCGYSIVGKFVAKELDMLGAEYVIVDNSYKHAKRAKDEGKITFYADMSKPSVIDALHVENAAAVIITLENFEKTRLICEALKPYAHKVKVIVRVMTLEEKLALEAMQIGVVVDGKRIVSHVLVEEVKSCPMRGSDFVI
ncbi:MAG: cation:proton antiporter [Campylobacterales bacterium]|nr:cation:proton antiporter [Campylobacterales bacterium]